MYIMTKRRRKGHKKRGTRKLFKIIKNRRQRMKRRGKKFRRTFRKRRKQLNLRFKSLRRGGVKTPTKRSVHAAAAAKKTAAKLHKKAKAVKNTAKKKNKQAAVATTKAAAAKTAAQKKAIHDPTSAAARKAAHKAEIAKKKAKKAQNDAAKTAIVAVKAKTKADKATKKAVKTGKATKKAGKATKKASKKSPHQTRKAPKHKTTPPKVSFKVGDKVILQGLQGRYDLNGKEGTIKSKLKTTGRYTIQLDVEPGTQPVGTGCKTGADCKSYYCKGGQCLPAAFPEIDIKPENMKLPRAPPPRAPPPPPKAPCNPFTITKVACPTLKTQFRADAKLCHGDQNKGPNAKREFQTLQKNYDAQKEWCAKTKGKRGTRPPPQDKDEWDCSQKTNAKWDEKTKKCVVEKKPPTKGTGGKSCKENKDCPSGSCVSNKCAPQVSIGKPCKKYQNCLSANCYTDAHGKSICRQGKSSLHSSCTNSEQCVSNACAGESGKRKCVLPKPKVSHQKPSAHQKPSLGGSTLKSPVAIGETKLPVADSTIFHKGDVVRIGSGTGAEVRTVVGHGSIILNQPLTSSHPQGTSVTIIAHAHAAPPTAAQRAAAAQRTEAAKKGFAIMAKDKKRDDKDKKSKGDNEKKSGKKYGEECANNADCASNVCSITLEKCSTKEAERALHAKGKEKITPLTTPPNQQAHSKPTMTKIELSPAAKEEVKKQFAAPPDSQGNRIVILKITGEQIGPSGAGASVVRMSGGLNAPNAVAATDDAVNK